MEGGWWAAAWSVPRPLADGLVRPGAHPRLGHVAHAGLVEAAQQTHQAARTGVTRRRLLHRLLSRLPAAQQPSEHAATVVPAEQPARDPAAGLPGEQVADHAGQRRIEGLAAEQAVEDVSDEIHARTLPLMHRGAPARRARPR